MFKKFKSMDEAFRQVRWLSLAAMGLSAAITLWVVSWSFAQVAKAGWNNFRSMVSGYEIVPANEPSYTPDR